MGLCSTVKVERPVSVSIVAQAGLMPRTSTLSSFGPTAHVDLITTRY
jgi:hypothetical protein